MHSTNGAVQCGSLRTLCRCGPCIVSCNHGSATDSACFGCQSPHRSSCKPTRFHSGRMRDSLPSASLPAVPRLPVHQSKPAESLRLLPTSLGCAVHLFSCFNIILNARTCQAKREAKQNYICRVINDLQAIMSARVVICLSPSESPQILVLLYHNPSRWLACP